MIKMFNYTIALYLERFFAGKQHLGLKGNIYELRIGWL